MISGTWVPNDQGFCVYRLPCGYCTQLEKVCPMQGYGVTYTTSKVSYTSNSSVDDMDKPKMADVIGGTGCGG